MSNVIDVVTKLVRTIMTGSEEIPREAVSVLASIQKVNKQIRRLRQLRTEAHEQGQTEKCAKLFEREKSIFLNKLLPLRGQFHTIMSTAQTEPATQHGCSSQPACGVCLDCSGGEC